ncbi:hypothetical protein [Nigerium massiliense]|uniref:hypothetical protein n=1 Tax=Nigerium massiliense TaxID=1522317 RepID=UPI0006945A3B|nr:hypothetical protein [Nigerium massiliense]
MDGLDSDLDLNGQASPRVLPQIGEWGATGVPTTSAKLRQVWLTVIVLVAVVVALVCLGFFAWTQLR